MNYRNSKGWFTARNVWNSSDSEGEFALLNQNLTLTAPQKGSLWGGGGGWTFPIFILCICHVYLKIFSEDNSAFQWQKKIYFWWKTKNDKKIRVWNFKISKKKKKKNIFWSKKKFFWSIFTQFQLLIEFSIFVRF